MNPTRDCGRHIEALSDYLDSGTSADAEHIEHCPQCQAHLAGLRSLSAAALLMMESEVASAADEDTGWLDGIMANLLCRIPYWTVLSCTFVDTMSHRFVDSGWSLLRNGAWTRSLIRDFRIVPAWPGQPVYGPRARMH